jgi:hypothetical protein
MSLLNGTTYKLLADFKFWILLHALLLLVIIWLFVSPPPVNQLPPNSTFEIIVDNPLVIPSPEPLMSVPVRAERPSRIKLLVNNIPIDEKMTDENYQVVFDKVNLRTGLNTIQVLGTAVEGGRQFRSGQTKYVKKDVIWPLPTPTPTPTAEATPSSAQGQTPPSPPLTTLAVSPSPSPAPPTPSAPALAVEPKPLGVRRVEVYVSYRTLEVKLEVNLRKDDPRVLELWAGKDGEVALPRFVRKVFYNFMIQGTGLADRFKGVNPEFEVEGDKVKVRASSNPKTRAFSFNLDKDFEITPDWRSPDNVKDAVFLNVKDYTAQFYPPLPANVSKDGATWFGSEADLVLSNKIRMRLHYDLLKRPDLLARQLRLSPYALFPFDFLWLVGLSMSFLVAIPMIWLRWLLKKFNHPDWLDENFEHQLKGFAGLLVALAFTAPAFFTINYLAANRLDWFAFFGFSQSDDLRLLILTGLLIYMAGWLLTLVTEFQRDKRGGFFLWEVFCGIRHAALICLAVMLFFGVALKVMTLNIVGLHQRLTMAVVFATFLLLLVKVYKLMRANPRKRIICLNRWGALFLIAVYLLLAFFLSFPRHPAILEESLMIKAHAPALEQTRTFFFLLLQVLPYMLFIGLLLLLSQMRINKLESTLASYHVGFLIFAAYVVGSTPNLGLIPIPFLIALWIFPRYVIDPATKCWALDRVRKIVVSRRPKLLERHLSTAALKDLHESREQLEKNRLAGDISHNDYLEIREELEQRIARYEKDSAFDEKTELKDVVVSTGLSRTSWMSGMLAVRKGTVAALIFSAFYLWDLLQRTIGQPKPYRLLEIIFPLVAFCCYWVVCAFFFGYFFSCFRGISGLRKGLNVSGAVIICLLPIWLFSFSSPLAIFLRAGQTFLFFTFMGFTSDYQIFRQSLGKNFRWRKLTQFQEITNFTAFASVLITGVGTTAGKAVTGHFDEIVKDLVDMAFQQLPRLPF